MPVVTRKTEMNYTIIGQDGKKYGPANAEHLRQWVAEGRVESRTPILAQGAADWTSVGLRPEFAELFAGSPPVIGALKTSAAPHTNTLATWGLVCGILAWTLCCCCIPFNILGLVFSIIALAQIQAHPGSQEGRGFAIAGIVLSATNLLWCAGLMTVNIVTSNANGMW
jgi:hypothetical protein